jgi:serine phosphatase RsbU (regulator of sigma subunit)
MNYFFRICFCFLFLSFGIKANASREDSLKALLPAANDTAKLNIYLKLGYSAKTIGEAKGYFAKAEHLADSLKNMRKLYRCYQDQGIICEKYGEMDTAMKFYFAALDKANFLHDSTMIGDVDLNISWLYFELNKFDQAEKFANTALAIFQRLGDKASIGDAYNDLATYKKDQGKFDEALKFHQLAFDIRQELHDANGLSYTLNNIGLVYLKMKKYPESIVYLEKSYHLKDSLHNVKGMAGSLINISNAYLGMSDFDKALDYALRGTKLADSSGNQTFLKNGYEAVANAYKGLKQFEPALEYMQKYINLKEKMLNEQNLKQVNELQAKYESDKKEQQIAMLNVKNNLQESELAKNKVVIIGSSVGIVLLLILAFSILRNNRVKKRTLIMISSIRDKLELKNQEISDSINYAKNIQRSLLPDPSQLSEVFMESFVLNLPKDIVSGDFFSLAQKNGKSYLAVADCTGHGVPGAFMSMIGTDKLSLGIQESTTGMPGEILSRTNHAVKSLLHQHDQNMVSKDGMDVALLCFDAERKKVFYAGANRPLWIIREGKIMELKPAKTSIGGTTSDDFIFPDHEIDLEKGDVLYLFSDGFADQFGGIKGKKLMTRHFRELLMSAYRQPLAEQKDFLLNKLKDWQGNFEQVDDILVLGMKV